MAQLCSTQAMEALSCPVNVQTLHAAPLLALPNQQKHPQHTCAAPLEVRCPNPVCMAPGASAHDRSIHQVDHTVLLTIACSHLAARDIFGQHDAASLTMPAARTREALGSKLRFRPAGQISATMRHKTDMARNAIVPPSSQACAACRHACVTPCIGQRPLLCSSNACSTLRYTGLKACALAAGMHAARPNTH